MQSYCCSGPLGSNWPGGISVDDAFDILASGKINVKVMSQHSQAAHRPAFSGGIRLSSLRELGKRI